LAQHRILTNNAIFAIGGEIACFRQQPFEAFPATILSALLTSEGVRNSLAATGEWNAPNTVSQSMEVASFCHRACISFGLPKQSMARSQATSQPVVACQQRTDYQGGGVSSKIRINPDGLIFLSITK
jgi:hypothetical protein